jgi:hypothetical protein
VVRFGIPPTESIPAIFQFALASLSAGRTLLPPAGGVTRDREIVLNRDGKR